MGRKKHQTIQGTYANEAVSEAKRINLENQSRLIGVALAAGRGDQDELDEQLTALMKESQKMDQLMNAALVTGEYQGLGLSIDGKEEQKEAAT